MPREKHRLIPRVLAASISFRRDVKEMLSLTSDQIRKLAEIGSTEAGFDISEESIREAVESLGLDEVKFLASLNVAEFLYTHARAAKIDPEDAARQACDFGKSLGVGDCEAKIPALLAVFAWKEAYDRRVLVKNSVSAVVPLVSEITAACDIRAVVEPDTQRIVGYVPVALIGIELQRAGTDHERLSFQVTKTQLDLLLDELQRARQSLVAAQEELSEKAVFLEVPGG